MQTSVVCLAIMLFGGSAVSERLPAAETMFVEKGNNLIAYRSSDRGKTWSGPTVAFDIPYRQHGFIPLIPRGSKRIYAFGTQPIAQYREGSENCPIGFRCSDDDGLTWGEPKVTSLVHPDTLPMRFRPADGHALVALHHNRHTGAHFRSEDRSEVWVSRSTDEGRHGSEPRFLLANALAPTRPDRAWYDHQCSYMDAFPDGDTLHTFRPHRWKRALHSTIKVDEPGKLPTRDELAG